MANKTIGISDELAAYVVKVGAREPEVLARLREETAAIPQHDMQIAPDEGAFLALLVELTGARRCIEIGTFTGYSSTVVALALPDDGRLVCCDVSEEWTSLARKYWDEAGSRARSTCASLRPSRRSTSCSRTGGVDVRLRVRRRRQVRVRRDYERLLRLVRPGGLIAFDNTLWSGKVLDEDAEDKDTRAIQALNAKLAGDERITLCLLPVADGVTLARRRPGS